MRACQAVIALGTHGMAGQESQCRRSCRPHMASPCKSRNQDLFESHITTVSQFVNQPQCNQLAKFLTEIRMLRIDRA